MMKTRNRKGVGGYAREVKIDIRDQMSEKESVDETRYLAMCLQKAQATVTVINIGRRKDD